MAGLLVAGAAAPGWAQVSAEKGPDGEVTQSQQPTYKCEVYDADGNVVQRYQGTEPPPDFQVPEDGNLACIGGASEETTQSSTSQSSSQTTNISQSQSVDTQGSSAENFRSSRTTPDQLPKTGGLELVPLIAGVTLASLGILARNLGDDRAS